MFSASKTYEVSNERFQSLQDLCGFIFHPEVLQSVPEENGSVQERLPRCVYRKKQVPETEQFAQITDEVITLT